MVFLALAPPFDLSVVEKRFGVLRMAKSRYDRSKMTDRKSRDKQIKKMKKAWIKEDCSEDFERIYKEELDYFEENFPDEKSCKKQLRFWLGWEQKKTNATFVCPKCGGTEAKVSSKKEGMHGRERLVFRCKTKGCRSTPSPRSVTIMAGSRSPLRFWFLCIYVIGLTNGKVPWSYLKKRRVNFTTEGGVKTIQARDMSNILFVILQACQDVGTRMKYCGLVRVEQDNHEAFKTYLSWYKSKSWIWWRVVFQDCSVKKTFLTNLLSNNKYEDVVLCMCLLREKKVQKHEWLLVVRVNNDNEITSTRWMYVSAVARIANKESKSYKRGYRYMAIQTSECPIENDQPFKVGTKFKNAFSGTWKQKQRSEKFYGAVLRPSGTMLKKINSMYDKQ